MKYQLLEKDKVNFISQVLLNEIIQFQHYFPVKLQGDDVYLEHYLQLLEKAGLLTIKKHSYVPTDKGRAEVVKMYEKYNEFLKIYDIYCAVDLKEGLFAFSNIGNDWSDESWDNYLNEERFSDVRVAVADFKGINPIEIVFLSFVNEGKFDCTVDGWQNALTSDAIWMSIATACNVAVTKEYLVEEGVMENIIREGTKIALDLIKKAEDSLSQDQEQGEETVTTVTETTEEYVDVVDMPYYGYSYYDPYWDPFYVNPMWFIAPLILF